MGSISRSLLYGQMHVDCDNRRLYIHSSPTQVDITLEIVRAEMYNTEPVFGFNIW